MTTEAIREHDLKCWPKPFDDVWHGRKGYEIRVNDRDYRVGDVLRLRWWSPTTETYSGREVFAEVTYMTRGGEWDLPAHLCVMSIRTIRRVHANDDRLARGVKGGT